MVFIFMSNAECLVLLVGDDAPQDPEQEVENLLNTDRDLSAPMRSQRSVYKGENGSFNGRPLVERVPRYPRACMGSLFAQCKNGAQRCTRRWLRASMPTGAAL